MDPPTVINLHGGLEGRYVIEEQRADGALVIRPETVPYDESLDEILTRHGERRLTGDEIPGFLGEIPSDGEG